MSYIMLCVYGLVEYSLLLLLYIYICPTIRAILLFRPWMRTSEKDRLFIFQIQTQRAWVYRMLNTVPM